MRNIFRKFALVAALTASALAPTAVAQDALLPGTLGYELQGPSYVDAFNIVEHANLWTSISRNKAGHDVSGTFGVGGERFAGFAPVMSNEGFAFATYEYRIGKNSSLDQVIRCTSLNNENGTLLSAIDSDFKKPGPEKTVIIAPDGTVTVGGGTKDDVIEKKCLLDLQKFYDDRHVLPPIHLAQALTSDTTLLPTDGAKFAAQSKAAQLALLLYTKGNIWREQVLNKNGTLESGSFMGGGISYKDDNDSLPTAVAVYDVNRTPDGISQSLICYTYRVYGVTMSIDNQLGTPGPDVSISYPAFGLFHQPTVAHGKDATTQLDTCINWVIEATNDETSKLKYSPASPMRHYSTVPMLTEKR